jgi:LmbE family N-acetylglucosaminyl deacetylase
MTRLSNKTVCVVVAHPDDETLWAGGTILSSPGWHLYIVCLCRGDDQERAARFYNALKTLKSGGCMWDLDDGPAQTPTDPKKLEQTILNLLPSNHFDRIITHNPSGEYTRHLRHEEVSRAVIQLWSTERIWTKELWTFAYEDGNKAYYPVPVEQATIHQPLTDEIWKKKYHLITDTYGFDQNSWEAKTTPKAEAFWQFSKKEEAELWLNNGGIAR